MSIIKLEHARSTEKHQGALPEWNDGNIWEPNCSPQVRWTALPRLILRVLDLDLKIWNSQSCNNSSCLTAAVLSSPTRHSWMPPGGAEARNSDLFVTVTYEIWAIASDLPLGSAIECKRTNIGKPHGEQFMRKTSKRPGRRMQESKWEQVACVEAFSWKDRSKWLGDPASFLEPTP